MSPELRRYINRMLGSSFEDVFFHTIATLYCPAYRQGNSGALLQDWPRIPLPRNLEQLRASAALGRNIAQLLDPEVDVQGVTVNTAIHFWGIAEIATSDATQIEPTRDLFVSENWGYVDARGAVMPGDGTVTSRQATGRELALFESLSEGQSNELGTLTFDVCMNAKVYWTNIPAPVWEFSTGGYPILKKWLSYRDQRVLDRALRVEELEQFQAIARRITSILLLGPTLDATYETVKRDLSAWPPE